MPEHRRAFLRAASPVRMSLALLALLFLLGACSDTGDPYVPDVPPVDGEEPQAPGATYWWNDQVFYEVFVRSYYDSDGDGIGDLRGLIERLDYLNDGDPATDTDLGVTALWLMPINAAPSYHGYDAVDYRTVDSDYGTNADFVHLMHEARARGMRVIVDYVMNHCSTQHPWFAASAAGDPAYADWFIWRQDNPGWTQPWGSGPVWHYNPTRGAYYYGVFWGGMPDLNYTNPAVVQEMLDIADFWTQDLGVDGFRLDAVKYMIEDGNRLENTPATFALWSDVRAHMDAAAPEAFLVGEAWDATSVAAQYVAAGLHTCFEFDLAGAVIAAVNQGSPATLIARMRLVMAAYPYHQYATFLTNHDQRRVLSQLGGNLGRNRVAAAILLTLPGVPFLYYGEEVGMTSSWTHEDVRRPLHWSSGPAAGFTSGTPWQAPGSNYTTNNIAAMQADPGSLWHHYRRLVRARTGSDALRRGTYHRLEVDRQQLFVFMRWHAGDAVVAVHNLQGSAAAGWTLSVPRSQLAPGLYTATDLLSGAALAGLTVGAAGSIASWSPAGNLPGHSSLLIQLVAAADGD